MSDPVGPFSNSPLTKVASDHGLAVDASLIERRCKLTVLSGDRSGTVVEIDKPIFRVGKDENADLALSDPTVSREHFVIEQAGAGAFVIRDERSTNGTWIDQFRIREAYLRPGTVLRAGEVQIRFEPVFRQMAVKPSDAETFGPLVGRSVKMRQIFSLLERVAKTEATVVLLGETGSGKSAVARAIHEHSPRKTKPFVTVDCGALPESLIESELFGHVKGAFTGAIKAREGALEQSQNGTLFIDELVDLPLHLQPKLLRVLEEREVRRVGANVAVKLDVRIIAASRKDLWREVEAGRFREDLYFRLAVFTIPLPPLRERKDDIPLLVESFARLIPDSDKLLQRLKTEGYGKLLEYPFYGNVRELRNLVERAVFLDGDPFAQIGQAPSGPTGPITMEGSPVVELRSDLPPGMVASSASAIAPRPFPDAASPLESQSVAPASAAPASVGQPPVDSLAADFSLPFKEAKERLVEAFEAEYVRRLIAREPSSASAMARSAGIDRKHLYNLAKKHAIDLKQR